MVDKVKSELKIQSKWNQMRCLVAGSVVMGDSHPGRHPLLHSGNQGGGHEGGKRYEAA